MDSTGGVSQGTIELKEGGKYSSYAADGTTGEGEAVSFKGVLEKTGKDTLTFHADKRVGGPVEGPGPTYELRAWLGVLATKR